nr:membrane protein E3 [Equid gammaherpesvirus 5]UTK45671.1 membrane protein E3 [Equid gammaherpesvirus 5]UTK45750.1 membrane protein E3 [Equid gammaherpesvirus 5]
MLSTRALVFLLCLGCAASTTTATTTDTSTPSPTTSSTPTSPLSISTTRDPTLPCEVPTLLNGNVTVTMNYSSANYNFSKNYFTEYYSSADTTSTWLILGFSFTCNSGYKLEGNATVTCLFRISGTVYSTTPSSTPNTPTTHATETTESATEDTTTPEITTHKPTTTKPTRPPWSKFGYTPIAVLVTVLVIFITLVVVHCVMKC